MAFRDSLGLLKEGPAQGAGSGFKDSIGVLSEAPERVNALTMQEAPTSARPRQVNALTDMVPFDEAAFRKWFTNVALRTGITPAPDIHPVDFRKAYLAGAEPEMSDQGEYVWSPEFQKPMPAIPRQVSPETIAAPTVEQISPETIGDPLMDEAGRREAMRRTAEAEIEKRLDEMIKTPFVKEQQAMGQPEKEIEAELGGVQQPWVDPLDVATTAGGFTAKFALSKGATLTQAIGRSLAAAGPAAAMDIPIGTLVDQIAEDNPELALLTSIGLGLASGITVENLAERGLWKLTKTIAGKYPQEAKAVLSEDVLKKFKEGAPSETWTPEISEAQAAKMEKWKAKAAARTQATEAVEEVPFSRSGGSVEDLIISHTAPEKPFSDSIHILNPPKESALMRGPVSMGEAKGKSIQAGMEASAKQREAAVNTEDLLPWIAKKGGLQPTPELEDLAWTISAEGRKVRAPGVPPNFLRKNSEWAMDTLTQEAIDEGFLPKGSTQNDLFDAIEKDLGGYYGLGRRVKRASDIEDLTSDELAEQEMEYFTRTGRSALWMRPETITGPLGGVAAGFDREAYEKDGTISLDPKKALIGAFAGVAGGAALPKVRSLGNKIANAWDRKVAEPFINMAKDTANGLIVHEDLRRMLGMGRSKAFQDLMREYQREVQGTWQKAVEIGKELQAVAPTAAEQKRLMQVIKGSITANKEMAEKAQKVGGLFEKLRENLKEHNLLEYSRFDKLTRKERARLRELSSMPDPATVKDFGELKRMAQDLGMTPKKGLTRDQLVSDIQKEIEFNRGRLNDYYHFGSAEEYAPIYYQKQEGLSPAQRKVLEDEINNLKVKSRRGNPEGQQDLEALISRLEGMLGEGAEARKVQRATHKALNKSYAHQRLEMPIEVQRMLGLIEEAPFPVAKGLGVQMSDLRKARLFQDIADQPGWTIRKTRGVDVPANFKLIEDERFGPLNNLHVRKDIWEDLKEVEEWRGWFTQNWDKALAWFKYGKVVINPSSVARNFYSNVILAYLGDVSPTDAKTWSKAFKAVTRGDKDRWYGEAKNWGLLNNTFYSSEIGKLRDELESVRDPSKLKDWIRKAMSAPGDLYQGVEELGKMAVFIKARESGMDVDQAARKAEKYLFSYQDIPPWVKHMKRWVSPFFTFTYKAVPLFAEMAIRKPHKVAAIMAAMYGMEEYSRRKLGLSDDEAEKERALLPEWQQRRQPPVIGPHTHVLMPFKDQWGDNLYLDLSYILPYGNLAEKWGQSALPLSDILPSNPLFQMAATIMTNREPFTGRPVYNEVLDSAGKIAAKYLEYSWREIAPSMAPGGYGWNKVKTGLMNTLTDKKVLDWADRPIELQTALLSSVLGIKMSPANTDKLKEFELSERKKIIRSIRQERYRLKGRYEKNELDGEEYTEEVKKLQDLQRSLMLQKREETGL